MRIRPNDPTVLLSTPDVCERLGIGRVTLWRWVHLGTFPGPDAVFPGGRKRWQRGTVDAWLQARQPAAR